MRYSILIAGGRTFKSEQYLRLVMDKIILDMNSENYDIEIVSGLAKGVDIYGKNYGDRKGYEIAEFPADWNNLNAIPCSVRLNKYNKLYNALAGHNRNAEMGKHLKNSDKSLAVLFWDYMSTGTANMHSIVKELEIPYVVINILNIRCRCCKYIDTEDEVNSECSYCNNKANYMPKEDIEYEIQFR